MLLNQENNKPQYLINFHILLKILSVILFIETAAFLICILVSVLYREQVKAFAWSLTITFLTAIVFYLITKNKEFTGINIRESYMSVTLSWLIISLAGTLPYIISGSIPSFINAFFESTSGFTTTGSSILIDIESLPKSILFWRSLTHWIGGMGIILLVIIILPSLNIGGYRIFILESSLNEKIHPRIRMMGVRLIFIYLLLSITETILLCAGGMNLFESACHTFGTIATGGFSPKNTSIALYSPYLQYVIMVFMVLSGMNFLIHYFLLKLNFKKILENEELWFYLVFIVIAGLIVTGILFFKTARSFETAFREAFFQVFSILTSTGFATSDYMSWPKIAYLLIFLFMFMGACTGSTSGGIKMARHLLMMKNIKSVFKKLANPNAVSSIRLNKREISPDSNSTIMTFFLLYLSVFVVGSIILAATGLNAETAFSSVLTCMGNIGPGIGSVGPVSNFNHIHDLGKILLAFLMITGRLEIYTIFALLLPSFWRK
jgi:trk system potassium uptake protein TrkH